MNILDVLIGNLIILIIPATISIYLYRRKEEPETRMNKARFENIANMSMFTIGVLAFFNFSTALKAADEQYYTATLILFVHTVYDLNCVLLIRRYVLGRPKLDLWGGDR